MKAISIKPGVPDVQLKEFPDTEVESPTQVKILEVGICGTDREEAMPRITRIARISFCFLFYASSN